MSGDGVIERTGQTDREVLVYAIGSVTIASTQMELAIGGVYAAFLRTDLAELVAHGQGFQTTVQAIRAILDHQPEWDVNEQISELLKKAERLYDKRNKVVHGFWLGDLNTGGPKHTIRFKRWGKREVDPWAPEDLLRLATDLASTGAEFGKLVKRLRAED